MKLLFVCIFLFLIIGCGPELATVKYSPPQSCTTTSNSLGSVITCPDGSTSTVLNGTGTQGPQGPSGSSGVINGTSLNDIVNNYNVYLQSIGQPELTPGLSCGLYTVPTSTTNISTASTTFVQTFLYTGVFNVPNQNVNLGLPILPSNLQSYQTWYILKCSGFFVNTLNGFHSFSLSSDDGSNLYIDGTKVINNDGLHSITNVTLTYNLDIGIHTFELDYFSGPPTNEALILNFDGNILPSTNLFN